MLLVPWFGKLWHVCLPVSADLLGVVLLVCFRIDNRAIFTLEGLLWDFSHALVSISYQIS